MDRCDFGMLATHEAESRMLRHSSVKFIDYNPPDDKRLRLAPQGSVMVYIGPKGSSTLAKVQKAARAKDGADSKLAEQIHSLYKSRESLSPFQAWRILQTQPVFADVRYGSRSLIRNVGIPPGLDIFCVPCPYNGGDLSPDELTLVEHLREDSDAALEAVALRREPKLTPAERAAIKRVPESQLELNLAPHGACCDSNTDFWVFVAVTVTLTCGNPMPDFHIYEDELKRLSPTAAAIRLMDARREALGHTH